MIMNDNLRSVLHTVFSTLNVETEEAKICRGILADDDGWDRIKHVSSEVVIKAKVVLLHTIPQASAVGREFIWRVVADKTENIRIRSYAATLLGHAAAEEYFDKLEKLLRPTTPPKLGVSIAYVFGYFSSDLCKPRATRALMRALRSETMPGAVRASAAESLGALEATEAIPLLIDCLSSEDDSIRFFSARALGWIGNDAAVNRLYELSQTDDGYVENLGVDGYWVRDEASEAIANIAVSRERATDGHQQD